MHTKGFTYVELLVVGAIMVVIMTLGIVSINKLQTKTSAGAYLQQIRSDLRTQQLAAMNGSTGTTPTAAGIYFENDKYTLFYGVTYVQNSTTNFSVTTDTPWQLASTFTNGTVVFSTGSGDISAIASGQKSVTISRADTGDSATLYINKYGVFQD